MNRKDLSKGDLSQGIEIEIIPFYESEEEFSKRAEIVTSIITRMIALGRKRGRPSTKEGASYDEAA